MDVNEFRVRGKEMVDYICSYMDTLDSRRVTPSVEPGYLRELLPTEAPQEPEDWDTIMADVENKIMPGVRNLEEISPISIMRTHIFDSRFVSTAKFYGNKIVIAQLASNLLRIYLKRKRISRMTS